MAEPVAGGTTSILPAAIRGRLRAACRAWFGPQDAVIEPIDADAFSGAVVGRVRLDGDAGDVVLKAVAAASGPRVAGVHRLMRHLRAAGAEEIPEVLVGPSGDTLVADDAGDLWEAVRYVPGVTAADPTPAQARAAATALARLHALAATWPEQPPRSAAPPAVVRRIEHARRMVAEPWEALAGRSPDADPLVGPLAARLAAAAVTARRAASTAVLGRIAALTPAPLPLQVVLRDVWSGHVIFAADDSPRVAGIVDLHAAAVDTPATDLARLLGSWAAASRIPLLDARADAIAAYAGVRPLGPAERSLVPWLDATGTIFALDNWFRWVLVEGRRFERPVRVLERVDRLLGKLGAAFEWLDRRAEAV